MARDHHGSSTLPAPASKRSTARAASPARPARLSTATEDGSADVLSDVLRAARLTGALFFPMEVSSPWIAEVPPATELTPVVLPGAEHVVSYHIVRSGGCWAALRGDAPVRLEAGDVFVVPHGDGYAMGSAADLRSNVPRDAAMEFFQLMASASAPATVTEGGGGAERAHVICGFLGCDIRPFNPAVEALPRVLHLRSQPGTRAAGRLSQLVELALAESREPQPGTRCVLLGLSELLFIEVVRRYLESLTAAEKGWLAGLRDPMVGQALALLHNRPADRWALARLAREIGSSRSALAERFSVLVGQPPMRYLTRWRIQIACRLLCNDRTKVSAVALDVGYQSEAAFSRAFKSIVGTSPAVWRRRHSAVPRAVVTNRRLR